MSVRVVLLTLAAVASASAGLVAPAQADTTVVVHGTAFPDPGAWLSFVGCASLYDRTAEPLQPYIGVGPGVAPTGQRSLGYDLAGGNAMGSLLTVASMTGTATASMAVYAADGATGVAYAGYRAPGDAETSDVWFGRADLLAAPGSWQDVEATGLSYTWTKYDMSTGQPVAAGPAEAMTVPAFSATQGGDGPGLYTIGFGCDGRAFSMDALRVGTPGAVTTYDLEGLQTATTMASGRHAVITAGDRLDVRGSLQVVEGGTAVPHATLVLEQQSFGSQAWETVEVVSADAPRVTVRPDRRTTYRWRFVDRPLAEASQSTSFVVDVAPRLTARREDGRLRGAATPTAPGTQVTLWRDQGLGPVAVDRGRIGPDGTYSLPLPDGAGRFFVTVPAVDGNLAGTSPSVVVAPPAAPPSPDVPPAGADQTAPADPADQPSLEPLLAPSPSPLTPSPEPSQTPSQSASPSPDQGASQEPSAPPAPAGPPGAEASQLPPTDAPTP